MKMMGMSDKDRMDIYTIVAGVLHLGNVSFEEDHDNAKGGCKVSASSDGSLLTAATFLGCEKDDLKEALVSRVMQAARGGTKGTIIK